MMLSITTSLARLEKHEWTEKHEWENMSGKNMSGRKGCALKSKGCALKSSTENSYLTTTGLERARRIEYWGKRVAFVEIL